MKPFAIEPRMLTMRGVFYPTGHMFVMFPTEADTRAAERELRDSGCAGETISFLTPQDIQQTIVRTVGISDDPLPSPGTEAATVRHYAQLASLGHHALLIHAPSARESDHVMKVLRKAPISYAQRYRHLVIEDLVE
jgi:hypothetical protein